ncbi:MAG: Holliday junction branch migration protein RuvA [Clostridia bacterium]|nr:Holliday junction branch migration protein RuvA [Clostridia bacterium]
MYAYIKGSLEIKTSEYIVIEAGGVGYKIFAPGNTINKLGEIGSTVKVYTHYHVREDNISLYGFSTLEELRMFELLIGVSGVGAKSATAILANITPSKFALSVISNDIKELTKLPGIGAKSAQRIILELKDKLKTDEALAAEDDFEIQTALTKDDNVHEAISALQVLGYPVKDATKAVTSFDNTGLSVEEIVKKSLLYFTRN